MGWCVYRNAMTPESLNLKLAPAPNLVFTNPAGTVEPLDTLLPGQPLDFSVDIVNVSPTSVELPFKASVGLIDSNNALDTLTISSQAGFAERSWNGSADLSGVSGEEALLLFEIDKARNANEVDRSSNVAFHRTLRLFDETNPLLRIMHEGELLQNEELLPADPAFELVFRDQLTYLREDSLATIELSLTMPNGDVLTGPNLPGIVERQSNASDLDRLSWLYSPGLLETGTYVLEAKAFDASGNASSVAPLRRTFEVDTRLAISSVLPYPNPMVDKVRFQYELTGAVPDDYQIDIYSSSGRLLRSLSPAELGSLRIGRNLTEGHWDGTDSFGQQLARGVYLYRFSVGTSDKGETFDKRETGANKFVKSGFGKLVILK